MSSKVVENEENSKDSSGHMIVHNAELFKSEIVDGMLSGKDIAPLDIPQSSMEQISQKSVSVEREDFYTRRGKLFSLPKKEISQREGIILEKKKKIKERNRMKQTLISLTREANTLDLSNMTSDERIKIEQIKSKKMQRKQEYENELGRIKREIERIKIQHQKRREEKFVELFNSLSEERYGFITELEKKISNEDLTERKKVWELYERWNAEVFEPIQYRILSQLENVTPNEITQRKCELFNKFLEETNKKHAVFRDIIIEADYDPLESRHYTIKYADSDLLDPTQLGIQKTVKELKAQGKDKQFVEQFKQSKSRNLLDVTKWDKIESTPHGRYSKMFSSKEVDCLNNELHRKKEKILKSHVAFDDYNTDILREGIKYERVQKGKRVCYTQKECKNMQEIVNGIEKSSH